MSGNHTELYVHMVWATWDRLPLMTVNHEEQLYASIVEKCREIACDVVAIGGIEDHVHLLAKLATTVSVAMLAREVKGTSSHLMTRKLCPDAFFKWQGSYGAFTISKEMVPSVRTYVVRQKEHHSALTNRGMVVREGGLCLGSPTIHCPGY